MKSTCGQRCPVTKYVGSGAFKCRILIVVTVNDGKILKKAISAVYSELHFALLDSRLFIFARSAYQFYVFEKYLFKC